MSTWHSAKELAGLPGMPGTVQGVLFKAKAESWTSRKRKSGKGFEYAFASLPVETQAALSLRTARTKTKTPAAPMLMLEDVLQDTPRVMAEPKPKTDAEREALAKAFDLRPQKQKDRALGRLNVVRAVRELLATGIPKQDAVATVCTLKGIDRATYYRWENMVLDWPESDWLFALVPTLKVGREFADISPGAWDFFKSDYLRLERPSAKACYERMQRVAKVEGWTVPSLKSLERRLKAEVSNMARIYMRDGERGVKRVIATQERDRSALHAMEAVNADGHKFDVFVQWPDGTVSRPIMVALQDLYSSKFVGYALAQSENVDVVRRAFGAMVKKYGIPEHVTFDNGRAFAAKMLTGGVPNRFRFKVKPFDAEGVLVQLNITLHWATPFHGQAKPIERAFRDLTDYISRHPLCAGAYCGNKPDAKPDNCKTALPFAEFEALVEQEMIAHNAREGRRTPVCNGRSFDAVFAESYAQSVVRRATALQQQLWLLSAEPVRVLRGGFVRLYENSYYHEDLVNYVGQRVVLRFDDSNLHADVMAYTLDGRFITAVPVRDKSDFYDKEAAMTITREQKRQRRALRELEAIHKRQSARELAAMIPKLEGDAPPTPAATQIVVPKVRGNAALAQVQELAGELANDKVNSAIQNAIQKQFAVIRPLTMIEPEEE